MTGNIITLTSIIFDPHSVFFLESQHCQVWTGVVMIRTKSLRCCSDLAYSIQHDVYINGLSSITHNIDEEDIFPHFRSGKYPSTWVVSTPDVCDDPRKYQSTAVPRTTARRYCSCKSYSFRYIYKRFK